MPRLRFVLICVALGGSPALPTAAAAGTDTEPQEPAAAEQWWWHGHDRRGHRHSPLSLVDRGNVGDLAPAWTFHSGVKGNFQTTPIMRDGVLYVSLPYSHVVALDAASGSELWRYEHERGEARLCCGPNNRGVAVDDDTVYVATVDARLVALDRADGTLRYQRPLVEHDVRTEETSMLAVDDPLAGLAVSGSTGVGAAMAPLLAEDKVIVGITGVGYGLHLDAPTANAPLGAVVGVRGRFGRAGQISAFERTTGRLVWQTSTIRPRGPEGGWEGGFRATTPDGVPLNRNIAQEREWAAAHRDAWRHGGGSVWSAGAFDAARGLVFVGTGNPSPQMDDTNRPGDNLYTVSILALDVHTGEIRWYYQQVPHDVWGYDAASPPVLVTIETAGGPVDAVIQAGKTGWLYALARDDGRLLFKSEAFVPQENLFARATPEGTRVAPGAAGGANWSPISVDASRQLAFVAALHIPTVFRLHEVPVEDGQAPIRYSSLTPADEPHWGTLSAISLRDGRITWQRRTDQPLIGGVLSTAGGLVFFGEGDGSLNALNSDTGERLWHHRPRPDAQGPDVGGANAPPITYAIDGRQYVVIPAGGNRLFGYPTADTLRAYALPR